MMFKVGLTGGIGSGKSLVSRIFEVLGAAVYDADYHAKMIMNDNRTVRGKLLKLLGEKAYTESGLNREYVASEIFSNPDLLKKMNAIVHPVVKADFSEWMVMNSEASYVIEEAAILFESGSADKMDMTIMVYAPEQIRINRVMKRDGLTESEITARIRNQLDDEKKKQLADQVIYNDNEQMLIPQIVKIHEYILKIKN